MSIGTKKPVWKVALKKSNEPAHVASGSDIDMKPEKTTNQEEVRKELSQKTEVHKTIVSTDNKKVDQSDDGSEYLI